MNYQLDYFYGKEPPFEDVRIKTSNQTEVFYYGKQKFN